MPRQKITQTDREQKEFRTLIRTIDTMCEQAYKNKSVLSKLKVASRFLITIIEDLDKKEESNLQVHCSIVLHDVDLVLE